LHRAYRPPPFPYPHGPAPPPGTSRPGALYPQCPWSHGIRFKGPKKDSHKRTITIDDDLVAMLLAEKEKHLRIVAGIAEGATVDLSLIKVPKDALMFPNLGNEISFVTPRSPRGVTKEFKLRATKLGFPIRLHDLRGTHETLLLDAGVPLKAVADRCGHDPGHPAPQLRQTNAQSRYQCGISHWQHLERDSWHLIGTEIVSRSRFVLEVRSVKCLNYLCWKGGRVV